MVLYLVVVNHGWQSESTDGPKGGWSCVFWSGLQCLQWSPHHKSWMQSVRSAVVVVIVVVVWCSGVVVVMLCNYCSVVAVVVVVSCGVV